MMNDLGKTTMRVLYGDGRTLVQVGDIVERRLFFRRRNGVVTYVPGVSDARSEMEHSGLSWIRIELEHGTVIDSVVDPETLSVKNAVRFVSRGERLADSETFDGAPGYFIGPDGVEWRREVIEVLPTWLARCLPDGAGVVADNGFGDYLFTVHASQEVMVYWHEEGRSEKYLDNLPVDSVI